MISVRRVRVAIAAAACTMAAFAQGQTYPTKEVRLVVPFAPGGGVDIVGRLAAEFLGKDLGKPVIVENRPGGGGAVAGAAVARAPSDGYTLLVGTGSTHGLNSAINRNLPYDAVQDFAPIALLATSPWLLLVNPSVPVNNVAEFIAYAKANPGKLNYASYGQGSSTHLAMELLKAKAKIDLVHIPYKGSAPALTDLIAGQVQVSLDSYSTSAPHIQAGKLRVLGVTTAKPASFAPNLETVATHVPGYESGGWIAMWAPANTPRPIIERLNSIANAMLGQSDVRARLAKLSFEPGGGSPEVLGQKVVDEVRTWRDLVKQLNLKFD